jgi:hypothetical protein
MYPSEEVRAILQALIRRFTAENVEGGGLSLMKALTPWLVLGPMEQTVERKVGILLEEEVFKLAKRRALEEGRPLSDVIQESIVHYLSNKVPDPKKRERAYQIFCERPMRISKQQFKEILKEDVWER